MNLFDIIRLLIFSIPLGIFVTFGLFLAIAIQMKFRKLEIIFSRLIAFYCLSASIASLLLLFYYYLPGMFSRLDILYYASVVFALILFYHFLYFGIKSDEPFGFTHYIIAGASCLVLGICKLLLPEFWTREGNSIILVTALVYGIVYSILPVYKMYGYHLRLTLLSNTPHAINTTRAVSFIIEVVLFPVTFIVLPLMTKQNPGILLSVLMMLCILLALRMNIPLTYAIIRHYSSPLNDLPLFGPYISKFAVQGEAADVVNSVEAAPAAETRANTERNKRIYRKYTRKNRHGDLLTGIDRKDFESYFRRHKPYLNPDLKISDLTVPLQSNRTYLSKFINHTYKMNFNSYINLCRLREMEKLARLPANEGKSPAGIAGQAGFKNYRHYLRVKNQLDTAEINR